MRWLRIAIFIALVAGNPAQAQWIERAIDLYNQQNFGAAAWNLKRASGFGSSVAAYNLGFMAERGQVQDCDIECATQWYELAGDRHIALGYTAAGALAFNSGQKERGIALLQKAARWNNPDARGILKDMGEFVPDPDLEANYKSYLVEQQYREQQLAIRAKEEADRLQVERQRRALLAEEQARLEIARAELARAESQLKASRAAENQVGAAALAYLFGYALGGGFRAPPPVQQNVRLETRCTVTGHSTVTIQCR